MEGAAKEKRRRERRETQRVAFSNAHGRANDCRACGSTRYSVLGTRYPVLGTRYSSTQVDLTDFGFSCKRALSGLHLPAGWTRRRTERGTVHMITYFGASEARIGCIHFSRNFVCPSVGCCDPRLQQRALLVETLRAFHRNHAKTLVALSTSFNDAY